MPVHGLVSGLQTTLQATGGRATCMCQQHSIPVFQHKKCCTYNTECCHDHAKLKIVHVIIILYIARIMMGSTFY